MASSTNSALAVDVRVYSVNRYNQMQNVLNSRTASSGGGFVGELNFKLGPNQEAPIQNLTGVQTFVLYSATPVTIFGKFGGQSAEVEIPNQRHFVCTSEFTDVRVKNTSSSNAAIALIRYADSMASTPLPPVGHQLYFLPVTDVTYPQVGMVKLPFVVSDISKLRVVNMVGVDMTIDQISQPAQDVTLQNSVRVCDSFGDADSLSGDHLMLLDLGVSQNIFLPNSFYVTVYYAG